EKILKDIVITSNKIREDKVLKSRFELLTSKYNSDKDRLIAINESTRQFKNYSYASCPTCEQKIPENTGFCSEKMSSVLNGTLAEINKIDLKIEDLKLATLDIEN
ncbi:TPA: hypothetical protein PMB07_003667, partial [Vibrio cholerae]|nr:hypothetical protein [Vibrio cholerae]